MSSELAKRLANLERQLEYANKWGGGRECEHYKELLQTCRGLGMPNYYDPAEWIRRQLGREYPEILDTVRRQLKEALASIEREMEMANVKCEANG